VSNSTQDWWLSKPEIYGLDLPHTTWPDFLDEAALPVHVVSAVYNVYLQEASENTSDDLEERAIAALDARFGKVLLYQLGPVTWTDPRDTNATVRLCNTVADSYAALFEREFWQRTGRPNLPNLKDCVVAVLRQSVKHYGIFGCFVLQGFARHAENHPTVLQDCCALQWFIESCGSIEPNQVDPDLIKLLNRIEVDGVPEYTDRIHELVGHYWPYQLGLRTVELPSYKAKELLQLPASAVSSPAKLRDFAQGIAVAKQVHGAQEEANAQSPNAVFYQGSTCCEALFNHLSYGTVYKAMPQAFEYVMPQLLDEPIVLNEFLAASLVSRKRR